jgi:alanine-glyoxylate transaminase/serine-glyoxylate transaminase/serine-pyruvate transaminase
LSAERSLLMIPGPTNVDPSVLRALAKPTTSHVSPSFTSTFKNAIENLKKVMKTSGEVFVVSGSGTLAMEMAVANVVEPNDRVLVVSNGYFGDRFVDVVSRFTEKVEKLPFEWGKAADPNKIKEKLGKEQYKAVVVVHVDTSTGVANDIRSISEVVKAHDTLFILDTVCSLGGMDVRVDEWGIDICLSGSQKALAVPPGLAILSAGKRALDIRAKRKTKVQSYYMDFENWVPIMRDTAKYFATPPVNMVYGFAESLSMIMAEGLEKRFARHAAFGKSVRSAFTKIGFKIVAEEGRGADTMTAAYYPPKIDDEAFRSKMATRYGVVVAGGLGHLKGKIFRVGHMGNVSSNDIIATIGAVEATLLDLGHSFTPGAGVGAAIESLKNSGY